MQLFLSESVHIKKADPRTDLLFMAGEEGLEPSTPRIRIWCSNRLNYPPAKQLSAENTQALLFRQDLSQYRLKKDEGTQFSFDPTMMGEIRNELLREFHFSFCGVRIQKFLWVAVSLC